MLEAVLTPSVMAGPPPSIAASRTRTGRPVDDPVYIRLIETIIACRKDAAVRQVDLAHKLGRPQSYVAKVENRERRIDVGEYVAWMRALEMDPVRQLEQILAV